MGEPRSPGGTARAATEGSGFGQRLDGWLYAAALAVVGPAVESSQRQDVIRRALLAPAILALLPLQRFHMPAWPAIFIACSAAVAYDIPLAYLVFVQKRFFLARVLAFAFDAMLMSIASVFVLRELGEAKSSSDIWLAFLVFAVSGGFVLAPIGSIIYTTLAMSSFLIGTLLYFPSDSQYYHQLVVRLVFFSLFGLMSIGIAQELEKRRMKLVRQNRQLAESKGQLEEKSDLLERALRTERERARREPLTGALNHAAVVDALRRLIVKGRQSPPLVVVMADVDSLKAINDTFGHQVGDTVLIAVSEALSREGAVVGRYGGDEFVVILPRATHETAQRYRQEVLRSLAESQLTDPETGAEVPVEVSLGFAAYPEEAETIEDLIKLSDSDMYNARRLRLQTAAATELSQRAVDGRPAAIVGEIVPLLTAPGNLNEKLRLVAHRLSTTAGFDAVDIQLDSDDDASGVESGFAVAGDRQVQARIGGGPGSTAEGALRTLMGRLRRPIIVDDTLHNPRLNEDERRLLTGAEIRSALAAPMIWQNEFIGSLWVGSKRTGAFGPRDAQLLAAVASQVTAIVRMATLVEELQSSSDSLRQAQIETVMMLAAAAEAHDRTTGVHLQGVRAITEALAFELGYKEDDAKAIGLASVLHDIGKISVPDALLANPGELNDAERDLMHQHTIWGGSFLESRPGFELAAQIARNHHERWDGGGYPLGLIGNAIPQAALVVAVADAFDAMVRDRPYRLGRPIADAVAEIEAGSGRQFSPKVVDALLRLHKYGALDRLHAIAATEARAA